MFLFTINYYTMYKRFSYEFSKHYTQIIAPLSQDGFNHVKVNAPGGRVVAPCYIGETSRPWRERIIEHEENRTNWRPKSFQIAHWMESHQLDTVCPDFKFEILKKYDDPLRRQIGEALYILDTGSLNRRMEFNENVICRLESKLTEWEVEKKQSAQMKERNDFNEKIENFISVMSSIPKYCDQIKTSCNNKINSVDCYRSIVQNDKKRKMDSSTPVTWRKAGKFMDDELESPIQQNASEDRSGDSYDSSVVGIMSENPTESQMTYNRST